MNIYFYTINNNESLYALYLVKGLRVNGHNIFVKQINNEDIELEQIKIHKTELIIFMGFSFMNHISYQMQDKILPETTRLPYIVMWYDNPFRYWAILSRLKDTNYTFFCCDSKHVYNMSKKGLNKTYYLPTCFDPGIQYPRSIDPNYRHPVTFAGTHMKTEKIAQMRSGRNIYQIRILNTLLKKRKRGQYFDYVEELQKEGIDLYSHEFGQMAFNNLMEQKHLLRQELIQAMEPFELHLYGQGDWLPGPHQNVIRHENLHQHTQLPILYSSSKINLTIEMLPASVHQRIMECAGCAGFIIGENKEDMATCFENYEIFENLEELTDKVDFYLKNEKERNHVANLMHQEALKRHTNTIRAKEIMKIWKKNNE